MIKWRLVIKRLATPAIVMGLLMVSLGAQALDRVTVRSYFKQDIEYADILIGSSTLFSLVSRPEDRQSAHERGMMAVEAIRQIGQQNHSLREIIPDVLDGHRVVARVGSQTVFEITPAETQLSQMPRVILVYEWCNRIRQDLGADLIPEQYVDFLMYKDRLGGNRISLRNDDGVSWDVVINDKTVMHFAKANYEDAARASAMIQQAVMAHTSPTRILPSIDSADNYGGKIAGEPFFTIDDKDVIVNRLPAWRLAMKWVDNVRTALGYSSVDYRTVTASYSQKGIASWYGEPFHGRRAASGQRYDMYQYSAAHKSLPFGSELLVTRLDTGDRLVVRINDRGPYVAGRIIDLSYQSARALGISGVVPVRIDVIGHHKVNSAAVSLRPAYSLPFETANIQDSPKQ